MVESVVFVVVYAGLLLRPRKRVVSVSDNAVAIGIGLIVTVALFVEQSVVPRWWIYAAAAGALAHALSRGERVSHTWQCPDCLAFCESQSLECACGRSR